jgi:hypothetical protein
MLWSHLAAVSVVTRSKVNTPYLPWNLSQANKYTGDPHIINEMSLRVPLEWR